QELVGRIKASHIDAVLCSGANQPTTAFEGPAALSYPDARASQPASTRYLPQALGSDWPTAWHPVLRHAPSGRVDGLWAATTDGTVVHHDGSGWSVTTGRAISVAAGADGSVFGVGTGDAQHQLLQLDGSSWKVVAQASGPLDQVAVGDAGRVWVRDNGNAVHRLDHADPKQPRLAVEPLLAQATHIDANPDGTVWGCTSSGSAVRFIAEAPVKPETVAAGGATRVASTSFGTAHFLVQQNGATQVQQYDSAYVFKTSQAYSVGTAGGIASGLGNLYFVDLQGIATQGVQVHRWLVALDARSGEELARSADHPDQLISPPVFDPMRELVYIALAPPRSEDAKTAGTVQALDPRDLQVKWEFHTAAGIDAAPALAGAQLCVGDRTGTVYLLDLSLGQPPKARWTFNAAGPLVGPTHRFRMPTPVLANDTVYGALWASGPTSEGDVGELLNRWTCSAADGSHGVTSSVGNPPVYVSTGNTWATRADHPPVLGHATFNGSSQPALFVAREATVLAINIQDPNQALTYDAGTHVTSGLAYDDGVLWFGDQAGTLYGLDGQLHAVPHTPHGKPTGPSPTFSTSIDTTPIVFTDSKGTKLVWFSVFDAAPPEVRWFGPGDGSAGAIGTGSTLVTTLSDVSNGTIYAAGLHASDVSVVQQVFGIRIDTLAQHAREFIVESQLMQDFDGPATPNGVARYQTHLTIVDYRNAPR
ncbi:MAG: PQQ-binding-like beta-propeller repeat protein, partial [Chloroflexi bacterium]|nr:PQQ-binding-like beta-propeller repeat protein [Chloroflexota bacterium]